MYFRRMAPNLVLGLGMIPIQLFVDSWVQNNLNSYIMLLQ